MNTVENNETPVVEVRKMFGVQISFKEAAEGVVTVAARDLDHAKEIVAAQYAQRENLQIHDAFDMEALAQSVASAQEAMAADTASVN